ncbi:hypothetical protein SLS54_004278 [Diplodia seriata]
MITTYSGRATTRSDVRCRQNEHAIIYTTPLPPKPLRGEDRLRQSIGAEAEGQAQCFSPCTRLNYGQEYDVAHTEHVCALAHVLKRDLSVFRADYLKVQGRVEGPSITSDEPLRSFSPSYDDSVDAIAIDPSDNLPLAREDEEANALQIWDQHNSTPEALHLPLTSEADQNNTTQIVNELEEDGGTADVDDRGSPDNLNLDTPQGHIESAEQDTPPLLERNEDEGVSELHNLAPEDPAEQHGISVVDDTDLVAIESPVTSKDVDVSTVDEKYPLDQGADPGLDSLTLDVSGTEDLDDPVYHHDRSSNPSSGPCDLDYNLDGPVEQVGFIQDGANAEVNSMCRTPDEAEDIEPSEPFIQASSHSPLRDQSLSKPLEAGHQTIIESLYRIKTQSTPSASPGTHTHPRPDLWTEWFQLAPHEIRACPHGNYTTPEGRESFHTTTTEEKSEGSLSPELADLSASIELTASYHTSATGVETDPASKVHGEMHEYEVTASESGSPTTAHDVSADSFSLDSNEQGLNAPELAREVTDSSSSSAAEFEKEVYFYSAGRADKTLLYALLDTGADRNFIRLDKAEAAGLELRPCTHLNFWAGDGSVVRPKYIARGARWRFVHKGGGIIWTDEFVVLEHMPRDVILGNGVIVKRSFLLSNETLCVLGLQALTLTKEERRKREEEERRKRLSDQERIKQQNLETRQQIIEKRQKKKLLQPKPEDNKDTEDEWYDCEEDSSIVATVGSRP